MGWCLNLSVIGVSLIAFLDNISIPYKNKENQKGLTLTANFVNFTIKRHPVTLSMILQAEMYWYPEFYFQRI